MQLQGKFISSYKVGTFGVIHPIMHQKLKDKMSMESSQFYEWFMKIWKASTWEKIHRRSQHCLHYVFHYSFHAKSANTKICYNEWKWQSGLALFRGQLPFFFSFLFFFQKKKKKFLDFQTKIIIKKELSWVCMGKNLASGFIWVLW